MKKLIQSLCILGTTGLTVAIAIGSRPANALTFEFSQAGWSPGGGEVTGTFSGEDKNGDNKIIFDFSDPNINEVSAYEMNFSGNSTFTDFTHNLNDLFILEYMAGNPDTLTISSTDFISSYDSENINIGLGVISQGGESLITDESVNVSSVREVPEPTSWIGLMLFGLGVYLKRKINVSFFH